MKILVVGGGGREHALAWKLIQSKKVDKIYCAPGNAGISKIAECVDIKPTDIDALLEFALNRNIDFTVVGMDDPLVLGIVDAFNNKGLKIFGPDKKAAELEGSKAFSKYLMKKYNIPTAEYEVFSKYDEAAKYIEKQKMPIVVKADGLALGKGVIICSTTDEAKKALSEIMVDRKFGKSGDKVVIEEFLTGKEISLLTFCDGKTIIPMLSSQDYKKAYDADNGPNTGGMGSICPSPIYSKDMEKYCVDNIFNRTVDAMNKEGRPFKGVIYFGLIITDTGVKVLEYNARFGDPETQAILPLLDTDLFDIMNAVSEGTLDNIEIKWNSGSSACVVLASDGYPGDYEKGIPIDFIEDDSNTIVFHAGTKIKDDKVVSNGGRVLGVTSKGKNIKEALEYCYNKISTIKFDKCHYRKDIGS